MLPFSLVVFRGRGSIKLTACEPTIYFVVADEFVPANRPGRKLLSSSIWNKLQLLRVSGLNLAFY